ncbi:hypothetical protein BUZ14_08340 [Staphylococcus gallinarum]|uniref:Smooth muscle caldesmon n=1 Tax=Staphylococcus gallinarum TaxID=1293 RepID=A0A3A0VXB5_STAGA|nr:hypothetical protein [Staphylococcus gallinarum]RIP34048.1 hypothetical protein BUZ14_08340 [Staphylococcus gallinarum]
MKYYNRDNYERNLESYEVPEYFSKGNRNIFVYGFIIGAVIGSAIGLVTLNKPRNDKYSVKQSKDNQFKSNIINQSEADQHAAEQQVADIKASINNQENVSTAELAAQKDAIKEEVAEHNLADTSPNAQHSEKDVNSTETLSDEQSNVAELESKHIDTTKEPSQNEIAAQQNAIKEETQSTTVSTESETEADHNGAKIAAATGGTVAAAGIAKAANDKNDKIANDAETADKTSELVSEENKVTTNDSEDTQNSDSESKSESNQVKNSATVVAVGTVTASGLAAAAKAKQSSIQKDSNVADKTANLLTPDAIKSNNKTEIPNLVTASKVGTSVESTDKVDNTADKGNKAVTSNKVVKPQDAERRVEQVHETVTFEDGIISHDKAGQGNNKGASTFKDTSSSAEQVAYNDGIISHSSSEEQEHNEKSNSTYRKNQPQTKVAEKAKSKIAKRTFND